MAAVTVTVKNKSGQTVVLTLDDESDRERIDYFRLLVKRDDLDSVDVAPVRKAPARKSDS